MITARQYTTESGQTLEVWQETREWYPGDSFEPPDVAVVRTELYVNGMPADPNKYVKAVARCLDYGKKL